MLPVLVKFRERFFMAKQRKIVKWPYEPKCESMSHKEIQYINP